MTKSEMEQPVAKSTEETNNVANKSAARVQRAAKQSAEKRSAEKEKIVLKDIDPDQYVTVKNGFQGRLVYISKKTGERFIWDGFGTEQEIELRELKNAKNSSKAFFENNWFMFDEDWIVDYLGVRRFYKNAVSIEEFDEIFTKDADSIKEVVAGLSEGQKKSAAYRARVLISEGKVDSLNAIKALEESLGVELIEP